MLACEGVCNFHFTSGSAGQPTQLHVERAGFAVTRTLRYIFCLLLLAAVVEAMLRARPRVHTRVLILRMRVKGAFVLGQAAARRRPLHVAEQDAVHGVQHKVVV